jgi:cytochrome c biogenesis protein CcmG/thiol:disulfide interchange protein DsbE
VSRRLRVLAALLLAAAAIAALVVFGFASHRAGAVGKPAPALPAERLAGGAVTLAGLRAGAGGRAIAVVFWASWCGPCQGEAAPLERFSRSPQGAGRIVGVDWSDALSGARAFIAHNHWSFPNVRDGEGTIGNRYGLTGLPTTFVLDARGRIRKALRGPQDGVSLSRALAAVEHA